jgi:rhamnulokinase
MGDDHRLFIAVDLGAGSGRVFLAGFAPQELMLEEVRRFHYPPRRVDGHLRWNARQILAEITTGLRDAADRARALRRTVQSIGIGWSTGPESSSKIPSATGTPAPTG